MRMLSVYVRTLKAEWNFCALHLSGPAQLNPSAAQDRKGWAITLGGCGQELAQSTGLAAGRTPVL